MSFEINNSSYIMQPYNVVSYDSRKENGDLPKVIIGKKCSIAMNCSFVFSNHITDMFTTYPANTSLFSHGIGNPSSYSKGDIIIKNDVWIGINCIILYGITIGNGAVIAAGSIVTKDVQPYAIVGGNPAKIIKYRFLKEIIDEIETTNLWDLDINEINKFNIHTKNINELLNQIKEYKLNLLN